MSKPPPPWTRGRDAVKKFYHDWCDTLEYEQAIEDGLRANELPDIELPAKREPRRENLGLRERSRYWHPSLMDSNAEAGAVWMAERNNFERLACLVLWLLRNEIGPRAKELVYQKLTGRFKARPGAPPELTPEERKERTWLPEAEWEYKRAKSFLTKTYPGEAVVPLALELALERMEHARVTFGRKDIPEVTEENLTDLITTLKNFMRRPANDRRRFVASPRKPTNKPRKTKP